MAILSRAVLAIAVLAAIPGLWLDASDLPFSAAWEFVDDMPVPEFPRSNTTHLLRDGRIFIPPYRSFSSEDGKGPALLFDPATGGWTACADPGIPAQDYRSSLCSMVSRVLPDGRVFVFLRGRPCRIYDPSADAWTATGGAGPDTLDPHSGILTTAAGEIYVFGGPEIEEGHLYDLATDTWRKGPSVPWYQEYDGAPKTSILPDGRAWLAITTGPIALFDPVTVGFRVHERHEVWRYHTLVDTRVFFRVYADWKEILYVSDIVTGTCTPVSSPADPTTVSLFSFSAGGRDWLGRLTETGRAGTYDCQVRDPATGAWRPLPPPPPVAEVAFLRDFGPLRDGRLFYLEGDGGVNLGCYRLRITSTAPPPPPSVADNLEDLVIREGRIGSFSYHLEGEVPAGGVTVVCERVGGGTADVRVVGNAAVTVLGRSQVVEVDIAALTDADADDESATIRVRIVQPGGVMDPNARTFTVTVPDAVTGGDPGQSHLPGDVNGDGVVNALDLDEVIDHFGTTAGE